MTAAVARPIGGEPQTYVSPIAPTGARVAVHMRFVTTRDSGGASCAPWSARCATALLEGLGARMAASMCPRRSSAWPPRELARLPDRTLTEIAYRALRPYTRDELDATTFEAVVVEALNFPIPLVEVEPGIYALELFHGPTLAFKDVGARTMARLMAALDTRRSAADRPRRHLRRHRQRRRARLSRRAAHARRRALPGRPRQPDAGSAADDVQRRGAGERPRVRGRGQLRRLPSADARGVRRRRASASASA